jgi:hypothetical protein
MTAAVVFTAAGDVRAAGIATPSCSAHARTTIKFVLVAGGAMIAAVRSCAQDILGASGATPSFLAVA